MACPPSSDRAFGPRVNLNCRSFDFTLQFEDVFLACLPAAVFLLLSCPYIARLALRRPVMYSLCSNLMRAKLTALASLFAIQLVFLALRVQEQSISSDASLAADVLVSTATLAACTVCILTHQRSPRSSTLLGLYLSASVILGVARVRTLWLLPLDQGSLRAVVILSAAQALSAVTLALESLESGGGTKASNSTSDHKVGSPEQYSSLWSRATFVWLLSTFWTGYRKVISLDDLPPLDTRLKSDEMCRELTLTWARYDHRVRYSLIRASFRTYLSSFVLAIIPRLCLTAFTFAQPFLVNATLRLMDRPDPDTNHGKGLIGAWALVYLGIAVSSSLYGYQNFRSITKLRGGLIAFIYQQSLQIRTADLGDITAVALMGTDVERIVEGLRSFHETWASLLEVGIACWLLEKQLSLACIAPIVLVVVFIAITSRVSAFYSSAQRSWVEKVQERLRVTSAVLGDMKAVKMLGLSQVVLPVIQGLRMDEIKTSRSFRKLLIAVMMLGLSPINLAPVVTFAAYSIIAVYWKNETLLIAQAFTSIALISLLTTPAVTFIQGLPSVLQCIGNFDRIQEYCSYSTEEIAMNYEDQTARTTIVQEGPHLKSPIPEKTSKSGHSQSDNHDEPIRLAGDSFAWDGARPTPILNNIAVDIKRGSVTAVIGPIGSGKSSFLNALLGELASVQLPSSTVTTMLKTGNESKGRHPVVKTEPMAYCAQQPWLENCTIRQNIVAASAWDWKWYSAIRFACCLDHDLQQLENGDQTRVGSKGVNLSGGQKQRIALARAIYAKRRVLLLDDVFSGMDARTANTVFSRLFAREGGLLRNSHTTVVLTTHNHKIMALADTIVVLEGGRVVDVGSLANLLQKERGYVKKLGLTVPQPLSDQIAPGAIKSDSATNMTPELGWPDVPAEEIISGSVTEAANDSSLTDIRRKNGALSVYRYYLASSGYAAVTLYGIFVTLWIFCTEFSTIWVSWWSEANVAYPNYRVGMYMGVYAMLGLFGTAAACIAAGFAFLPVISNSASRLHLDLLTTTLRAPFHFFSKSDNGELLNRFGEDMQLIDMDLPMAAVNYTSTAVACLAQVIILVIFSKSLGIAMPFIFAFLYLLQRFYLQTSRQMRLLMIESKAPLYTHFSEAESTSSGGAGSSASRGIGAGAVTIRAFGWQSFYQARASALTDRSQQPAYLQNCIQSWLGFVLNTTVAVLAVILVATVVTWRDRLDINAGGMGVSLIILIGLSQTLARLIRTWTTLESSVGAVARVRRFVTETESEDVPDRDAAPEWPRGGGAVEFDNLVASYKPGADPVLHSISFSVQPGKHIAICGRSGSGKTSLIMCLLRMMEVRSGRITLNGVEIASSSAPSLLAEDVRSRINVVPQDPFLVPNSTVRFNIDPFPGTTTDEEIVSVLQRVGLWDAVRGQGGLGGDVDALALSAGQKQLLCLARAMVGRKRCDLLVLDEATSSLDTEAEAIVQDIIDSEFRGCTVLAVMHRLTHIAAYDQVALLDAGFLVELGEPAELIAEETRFAELYKSHAK